MKFVLHRIKKKGQGQLVTFAKACRESNLNQCVFVRSLCGISLFVSHCFVEKVGSLCYLMGVCYCMLMVSVRDVICNWNSTNDEIPGVYCPPSLNVYS